MGFAGHRSENVGPGGADDPAGSDDSLLEIVECLITASKHSLDLEEDVVFGLVVRASGRMREVAEIAACIKADDDPSPVDAVGDAFKTLDMTLSVLVDVWSELTRDGRQVLLQIASQSLSRFCYLSRPPRKSASVALLDASYHPRSRENG